MPSTISHLTHLPLTLVLRCLSVSCPVIGLGIKCKHLINKVTFLVLELKWGKFQLSASNLHFLPYTFYLKTNHFAIIFTSLTSFYSVYSSVHNLSPRTFLMNFWMKLADSEQIGSLIGKSYFGKSGRKNLFCICLIETALLWLINFEIFFISYLFKIMHITLIWN